MIYEAVVLTIYKFSMQCDLLTERGLSLSQCSERNPTIALAF